MNEASFGKFVGARFGASTDAPQLNAAVQHPRRFLFDY
jgi:hypothetical protein